MGTNSTRLFVADVDGGRIVEQVKRESRVTRLGRGVDLSGQLAVEAIEETCSAVRRYLGMAGALAAERIDAIATSAVRDAANADAFMVELRERFGLDARTLDGVEEAHLTYLGATSTDGAGRGTLVIDIGGGSTELVLGSGPGVSAHASLQIGAVRHSERHLRKDPPETSELELLAATVREAIDGAAADFVGHTGFPTDVAVAASPKGIAVAGTATSLAAIDLALEPYDSEAVHGHVLPLVSVQRMCSELTAITLAQRREVPGLHPDRAPTIIAGVVILIQTMRAFDLDEITISECDLLDGAALEGAAQR